MSSSRATDRAVTRNGVDLAVRDHGGQGPGLLLSHGFGRTLVDWAGVAPHLTGRHRVLAMDLRAHGHSGTGPWTLTDVLDDVAAALDVLALPDAWWPGTRWAAWSPSGTRWSAGTCAGRAGPQSRRRVRRPDGGSRADLRRGPRGLAWGGRRSPLDFRDSRYIVLL